MNLELVFPLLIQLRTEANETSLETWLGSLVSVTGVASAGFRWPLDGDAQSVVTVGQRSATYDPLEEAGSAIRAGLKNESPWVRESESTTLFATVSLTGRRAGLFWMELPASTALTSAHRVVVQTVAVMVATSPLLTPLIGASIDQTRLLQRIADSSIVCGRMAHDFDNILTGILGFTDLTLPMLPAGSLPLQYLTEVSKVGQRGIVFTQQLHQLSRSGQIKPQPCSAANVLSMEETRLKAILKPELQLQIEVPVDLPVVAIDVNPLQTVLGHVLENAIEASPQGGTIRVTGQVIHLEADATLEWLGNVAPGPHVELKIQDEGTGIKPEVRNRLFVEPFYTTKVRHRGLGLAIIYRILHAHRGGIQIDSPGTPNSGTLVRLILPVPGKKTTNR